MMSDFDNLAEELKQLRDELALKMHLASMEARDEWYELEKKWKHFSTEADFERSAEGLGDAMSHLGDELKKSYTRIKAAING